MENLNPAPGIITQAADTFRQLIDLFQCDPTNHSGSEIRLPDLQTPFAVVNHQKFGKGVVKALVPGERPLITVRFEDLSLTGDKPVKTLDFQLAKLTFINPPPRFDLKIPVESSTSDLDRSALSDGTFLKIGSLVVVSPSIHYGVGTFLGLRPSTAHPHNPVAVVHFLETTMHPKIPFPIDAPDIEFFIINLSEPEVRRLVTNMKTYQTALQWGDRSKGPPVLTAISELLKECHSVRFEDGNEVLFAPSPDLEFADPSLSLSATSPEVKKRGRPIQVNSKKAIPKNLRFSDIESAGPSRTERNLEALRDLALEKMIEVAKTAMRLKFFLENVEDYKEISQTFLSQKDIDQLNGCLTLTDEFEEVVDDLMDRSSAENWRPSPDDLLPIPSADELSYLKDAFRSALGECAALRERLISWKTPSGIYGVNAKYNSILAILKKGTTAYEAIREDSEVVASGSVKEKTTPPQPKNQGHSPEVSHAFNAPLRMAPLIASVLAQYPPERCNHRLFDALSTFSQSHPNEDHTVTDNGFTVALKLMIEALDRENTLMTQALPNVKFGKKGWLADQIKSFQRLIKYANHLNNLISPDHVSPNKVAPAPLVTDEVSNLSLARLAEPLALVLAVVPEELHQETSFIFLSSFALGSSGSDSEKSRESAADALNFLINAASVELEELGKLAGLEASSSAELEKIQRIRSAAQKLAEIIKNKTGEIETPEILSAREDFLSACSKMCKVAQLFPKSAQRLASALYHLGTDGKSDLPPPSPSVKRLTVVQAINQGIIFYESIGNYLATKIEEASSPELVGFYEELDRRRIRCWDLLLDLEKERQKVQTEGQKTDLVLGSVAKALMTTFPAECQAHDPDSVLRKLSHNAPRGVAIKPESLSTLIGGLVHAAGAVVRSERWRSSHDSEFLVPSNKRLMRAEAALTIGIHLAAAHNISLQRIYGTPKVARKNKRGTTAKSRVPSPTNAVSEAHDQLRIAASHLLRAASGTVIPPRERELLHQLSGESQVSGAFDKKDEIHRGFKAALNAGRAFHALDQSAASELKSVRILLALARKLSVIYSLSLPEFNDAFVTKKLPRKGVANGLIEARRKKAEGLSAVDEIAREILSSVLPSVSKYIEQQHANGRYRKALAQAMQLFSRVVRNLEPVNDHHAIPRDRVNELIEEAKRKITVAKENKKPAQIKRLDIYHRGLETISTALNQEPTVIVRSPTESPLHTAEEQRTITTSVLTRPALDFLERTFLHRDRNLESWPITLRILVALSEMVSPEQCLLPTSREVLNLLGGEKKTRRLGVTSKSVDKAYTFLKNYKLIEQESGTHKRYRLTPFGNQFFTRFNHLNRGTKTEEAQARDFAVDLAYADVDSGKSLHTTLLAFLKGETSAELTSIINYFISSDRRIFEQIPEASSVFDSPDPTRQQLEVYRDFLTHLRDGGGTVLAADRFHTLLARKWISVAELVRRYLSSDPEVELVEIAIPAVTPMPVVTTAPEKIPPLPEPEPEPTTIIPAITWKSIGHNTSLSKLFAHTSPDATELEALLVIGIFADAKLRTAARYPGYSEALKLSSDGGFSEEGYVLAMKLLREARLVAGTNQVAHQGIIFFNELRSKFN